MTTDANNTIANLAQSLGESMNVEKWIADNIVRNGNASTAQRAACLVRSAMWHTFGALLSGDA